MAPPTRRARAACSRWRGSRRTRGRLRRRAGRRWRYRPRSWGERRRGSRSVACSGDGDQLVLDTLIQGVIASPLPKHSASALLPPCCANAPQSRFAAQRSIVLCEFSKVAGPTHLDLRGYALEFPEIVCGKLDVDRREVLLQAVELRDG